MENKVLLFPLLKKGEQNIPKDKIKQVDIEALSNHYRDQLLFSLTNHNLTVNKKMIQDLEVVKEIIKSTIMRNLDRHHPFQDYIDEIINPSHSEVDETERE